VAEGHSIFNDLKQGNTVMDIKQPGLVKAGTYIALGWEYYETRAFILKALVDIDLSKDLSELKQRLIDAEESPEPDLKVLYLKAIERWTVLGFVEQIKDIHQFNGGADPSSVLDTVTDTSWVIHDH
jgi:hypothetical protein